MDTYKKYKGAELSYIRDGLSRSVISEILKNRFGMSDIDEWEDKCG